MESERAKQPKYLLIIRGMSLRLRFLAFLFSFITFHNHYFNSFFLL